MVQYEWFAHALFPDEMGEACTDEMGPVCTNEMGGMQRTSAGLHLGTDPKINLWSDVFSLRLHYT